MIFNNLCVTEDVLKELKGDTFDYLKLVYKNETYGKKNFEIKNEYDKIWNTEFCKYHDVCVLHD